MIINSASALPDNISNPAPDRINEDQNLGQAGIEMTQPTTTERQEMVSSVGVGSGGTVGFLLTSNLISWLDYYCSAHITASELHIIIPDFLKFDI